MIDVSNASGPNFKGFVKTNIKADIIEGSVAFTTSLSLKMYNVDNALSKLVDSIWLPAFYYYYPSAFQGIVDDSILVTVCNDDLNGDYGLVTWVTFNQNGLHNNYGYRKLTPMYQESYSFCVGSHLYINYTYYISSTSNGGDWRTLIIFDFAL